MVLKAIKELATGFEGCEKKIEIDYLLTDKTKTLRNIPRPAWDEILEEAKCTIIGTMSNDDCDSYVLSESSLFVFPSKILIKTCGTTSLLNCIVKLMHHAKSVGAEPDFLQFSRSNFLFPQLQPFPHRNFDMESQYLNTLFQGQAYILGPINGPRWHLYIADFNRIDAKEYKQQTLELVMFNLDPAIMKTFYKRDESDTGPADASLGSRSGVESTSLSGIDKLIPGSTIDSHQFAPCGYSCNGLLNETYFTIHITPEPECSFVSFETNLITANYTSLVQQVLSTFRPGSFCMSLFVDEQALVSDSRTGVGFEYTGYVNKNVTHHVFEGGYNAACGHFEAISKSTNSQFGATAYQPIHEEHMKPSCIHTTNNHNGETTPPTSTNSFQFDYAGKLAVSYDTARRLSHEQMRVLALEAVRGRFELENYDGSHRSKQQSADLELVPATTVTAHVRRLANQVIKQHAPESAFCLVDIGELVRRFYHWTYVWSQVMSQDRTVEPVYAVCGNGGDDGVFAALHALGCLFSCMSSSSLHSLLDAGIHHSRLLFTTSWKSSQHITYARTKHVHLISFETLAEMKKIISIDNKSQLILQIAIPQIQSGEYGYGEDVDVDVALVGVGAGMGVLMEDVMELLKQAKEMGAHVVGVRFTFRHVVTDLALWRRALLNAHHVITLASTYGHTINILDIGGGLPTYSHEFMDDSMECKSVPSDSFEYIVSNVGKMMNEIISSDVRILCNAAPFFTSSTHTLVVNIVGKRALESIPIPVTPVSSPTTRKRPHDMMESSPSTGYCYYVNDGLAGSYDRSTHIEAEPLELIAHVTQASIVAGATPKDTVEQSFAKKPRLASSLYGVTSDGVACLTSHTLLPELDVGDWLFIPNMGSSFNAPKQEFHGVDPPTVRYIHT